MKNYFILKSPKNLDQEAFKNTNLNFVLPFYPGSKSGVYDKNLCRMSHLVNISLSLPLTSIIIELLPQFLLNNQNWYF